MSLVAQGGRLGRCNKSAATWGTPAVALTRSGRQLVTQPGPSSRSSEPPLIVLGRLAVYHGAPVGPNSIPPIGRRLRCAGSVAGPFAWFRKSDERMPPSQPAPSTKQLAQLFKHFIQVVFVFLNDPPTFFRARWLFRRRRLFSALVIFSFSQ